MSRGISPAELDTDHLLRELEQLHGTRNTTLRHGSDDALQVHTERTAQLEQEYLRRFPQREVDPDRTRAGARTRPAADSATDGVTDGTVTDSTTVEA